MIKAQNKSAGNCSSLKWNVKQGDKNSNKMAVMNPQR